MAAKNISSRFADRIFFGQTNIEKLPTPLYDQQGVDVDTGKEQNPAIKDACQLAKSTYEQQIPYK